MASVVEASSMAVEELGGGWGGAVEAAAQAGTDIQKGLVGLVESWGLPGITPIAQPAFKLTPAGLHATFARAYNATADAPQPTKPAAEADATDSCIPRHDDGADAPAAEIREERSKRLPLADADANLNARAPPGSGKQHVRDTIATMTTVSAAGLMLASVSEEPAARSD